MSFLGLGKTLFNSSVCHIDNAEHIELLLTERLLRNKASGAWPGRALSQLSRQYNLSDSIIYENRDVEDPAEIELLMNSKFPFFETLKLNGQQNFSRHFNNKIKFVTHHLSHAYAAAYMSPFEKSLILVIDGAGTRSKFFEKDHPENTFLNQTPDSAEERTLYLFDRGKLTCVDKKLQTFTKSIKNQSHYFSKGLGTFYEKISEYVFNSKRSAGKVMGLAALGNFKKVSDSQTYLENLDWSLQFKGKSKQEWENSPHFKIYCDLSADIQNYFEEDYIGYIKSAREKYPDYKNIIITGGCALNCTSNMKLFDLNLFDEIYVPPFPGDESIGLGTAYMAYIENGNRWKINSHERQHGYFGSTKSVPKESDIFEIFKDYEIIKPVSIAEYAAQLLSEGHIIGWFQGRSESGPRALGNRSILSRPDKAGVKNHLNSHIKFRESFRPYGCSTLFEKSHLYFAVPEKFNNPYMSFATKVKPAFREILNEVTHIDGTSRMQTVRSTQNKLFYELISEFGKRTNLFVLLNTSLNIMGEPIVENLYDAKNFLDRVSVYGFAAGDFFIKRR